LLKEFLRKKDLDVHFEGNQDFLNEEEFDNNMKKKVVDILKTKHITIKETQINKL